MKIICSEINCGGEDDPIHDKISALLYIVCVDTLHIVKMWHSSFKHRVIRITQCLYTLAYI